MKLLPVEMALNQDWAMVNVYNSAALIPIEYTD